MKQLPSALLADFGLTGLGIERGARRPDRTPAAHAAIAARVRAARAIAHAHIVIVGVTAIRGDDGFGDTAIPAPRPDPRASWQRLRRS